ncbi:MAG: hypothetical protein HBSAPP03_24750 [Phycisphaerae bacterium]|nr:MAG: hypothetical protein HBSAPP03_24750 [Phycisphaerae bacterium]
MQAVRPAVDGTVASPDDAALIAGLIERAGFEGTSLVMGVPGSMLMTSHLELPPRTSGAPIEQIARMEMARAHRVDPASFELALWDVPPPARARDGCHAIGVGLASAAIDPFLAMLDAHGLTVIALDVRSLALARATAPLHDPDGMTCIVDASWDGLGVVVVHQGIVVVDRVVDGVAWGDVCARAATRLGLSSFAAHDALAGASEGMPRSVSVRSMATEYFERLVPEVERSMTYITHRYPDVPTRSVLIVGDAACLPGLKDRLAQAVSAQVVRVDPLTLESMTPSRTCQADASCIAAMGLAWFDLPTNARRAA